MFVALDKHQKERMSHEEFAVFKEDRQRYNVFQTCKDLASCVQDALGPMTSMVWNQQKIFFSGTLNISQIIQMYLQQNQATGIFLL